MPFRLIQLLITFHIVSISLLSPGVNVRVSVLIVAVDVVAKLIVLWLLLVVGLRLVGGGRVVGGLEGVRGRMDSMVNSVVSHWGVMNSMVSHWGVVDSMVSHWGSVDGMVSHRGSVNSMASMAAESCEGSELSVGVTRHQRDKGHKTEGL